MISARHRCRWVRIVQLTVLVLVVLLRVLPAHAEARVALVVGVGAYTNVPALPNTRSDATAIGAALQRLGFAVEIVLDPDKAALDGSIRRFGQRAAGADAAIFYYAGHALESGGKNWILPTAVNLRTVRDLPFEAFDLDVLLDQLDGAAGLTVLILDACRDNPFRLRLGQGRGIGGSEGLAQLRAAAGTLIEYATAPGTVAADGSGPHSPFTTALLQTIERPGVEIHQVFAEVRRVVRKATQGRQIPWESSAMEGEFYFSRPPAPVPTARVAADTPPKLTGQTGSAADEAELMFWKTIADSHDRADFLEYLAKYPNGLYAGLARNRLRQLDSTAPTAPRGQMVGPPPGSASDERRETLDADMLRTRLTAELTSLSDAVRQQRVARYLAAPLHRMFAMRPNRSATWYSDSDGTARQAEENGLERCQMYFGAPCDLLSVDQVFVGTPGQADRAPRDMPRVGYAGLYDPQQIPGIYEATRERADVVGYGAAAGPKAIAIHPWGRVFVATASDQHAAEEKVLNDCDDDPYRKGDNGPCYLYAVGNQVVLPARHADPMDAEAAYQRITAAIARVAPTIATDRVADYASQTEPKAIALHVETARTFLWSGTDSYAAAARLALEGCQQSYGSPCVLLAVGTDLGAPDPSAAPRQDMPRLHVQGAFRPENVPFVMLRYAPDLQTYAALPGAKAIAIRAFRPRYTIASGANSIAEAERKALAACNDPSPDFAYPCFIYAAGDRVVLPERRTEAGP